MNALASFSRCNRGTIVWVLLLLAAVARGSDTLDIWQWRNPLPTGNFTARVKYLENQFVALPSGIARELLTSPDGRRWVSHPFQYDAFLNDVAYGNGRYVVVGVVPGSSFTAISPGFIASSADLTAWTRHVAGATNPLQSVTFGASVFVTVGYHGYLATSTSGASWIAQNSGTSDVLIEAVYGNGTFVVSKRSQNVLISNNGTNWVSNIPTNGADLQWLSYAGGRFYAAGYLGLQLSYFPVLRASTDGLTWTAAYDPRYTGQGDFHVVAGDGMVLGVLSGGPSPLSSSADGVTFTNLQPNGYNVNSSGVAFGSDLFVNSALQTSADGVNWSQTAVQPTNSGANKDIYFLSNQYVAMGTPYFTSSNGLRFSPATNTLPSPITRVRQANGLFVGVGSGGAIYRSTDGWNWEARNSSTPNGLTDVAYGNGLWVAVGGGGTVTVSSTANAWSLRNPGTALTLNGVVFAAGLFVAVGENGTVLTSTDGSGWTPQYAGTLETFNKIAYGNGQFVAVGANGSIVTSTDAVDWTLHSNVTTNGLSDIDFGEGVYCAVNAGEVFTSQDGNNWTSRRSPSANSLGRVRFLNGTFFLFGGFLGAGGQSIVQSGPVTPAQLAARWNSGTPQINIHATPNLVLRLEAANALPATQWDDLGLIQVPAGGAFVFEDTSAAGHVNRFYRASAP